jgi:hypothetical protein
VPVFPQQPFSTVQIAARYIMQKTGNATLIFYSGGDEK